MRITINMLERRVEYLNKKLKMPITPYSLNEKGMFKANLGNYHLENHGKYFCLSQIANESGGIYLIIGFSTKKELLNLIDAYIAGINIKEKYIRS